MQNRRTPPEWMNKILVSRIGEIVKRKLNGNRLFGNSFTTLQAVSACWGRTPTPVNSPVAGTGCAFVSRTLLFLLRRKRRSLRALAKWKSGNSNSCHHHRIAARQARDCLDNSQISSRRFCKSSMSAA